MGHVIFLFKCQIYAFFEMTSSVVEISNKVLRSDFLYLSLYCLSNLNVGSNEAIDIRDLFTDLIT